MLAKTKEALEVLGFKSPVGVVESLPLWQLEIAELAGHSLEAKGREEVNRMQHAGWRLLHIYTLKFEEDGTWRERPMAILGQLRTGGE
jgi:FtsZ-binding cell division protein ZapB